MTWQPISTAPKDGTLVLVWDEYGQHQIGCWTEMRRVEFKPLGDLFERIERRDVVWTGYGEPQAWQPLPPPPGEERYMAPSLIEKVARAMDASKWLRLSIRTSDPVAFYEDEARAAIQVVLREMMEPTGAILDLPAEDYRIAKEDWKLWCSMISAFAKHHHIDLT